MNKTKHLSIPELLDYNPITGEFRWKIDRTYNAKAGSIAGVINGHGYRYITVQGKLYRASRLAWFLSYGEWPENQIDHIDQNRSNDVLSNLREITHQENLQNSSMNKNNTSGVKGVHWVKTHSKWRAMIQVDKIPIVLGYFSNKWDAICARKAADYKYGFHINHGNLK